MPDIFERRKSLYVGNLRRSKRLFPLDWYHILIASADLHGNLQKTYTMIQFVGCKVSDQIKYLLLCKECNMEADSLQQIIAHGQVSSQFYDRCVKNYCIHCQVGLELELE